MSYSGLAATFLFSARTLFIKYGENTLERCCVCVTVSITAVNYAAGLPSCHFISMALMISALMYGQLAACSESCCKVLSLGWYALCFQMILASTKLVRACV